MTKVALVVEGDKDVEILRKVSPSFHYIVTRGTRMNARISGEIQLALRTMPVYVLSDPDDAGDIMYEMVRSHFPSIPRITLSKSECTVYSTRKKTYITGVEHAELHYLVSVFKSFFPRLHYHQGV